MNNNTNHTFTDIRLKALERLNIQKIDSEKELHELQVFQEELLIQQESLQETNSRLEQELKWAQTLFDEAPIAYFTVDKTGLILKANFKASQLLNIDRLKLSGSYLTRFFSIDTHHIFLTHLRNAFQWKKTQICTVHIPFPNKSTVICELQFKLAYQSVNNTVCLISLFDVTHLRQTEIALENAKAEAEEANFLKGRFLANMSHEVRNPIALILGHVDLLLTEDFDENTTYQLSVIKRAGKNLLNLLNDVVDFSKVEANQIQIENKPFKPKLSLQHIIDIFQLTAKERLLTFNYKDAPDAPLPEKIIGDKNRLDQILMNIVSNAIKFTPNNGHIFIRSAYRSGNLLITVEDSGPGIPEELLETIFEPFRQVNESDSRNHGGAGLGLAISRQVINLMKGELYAANIPDGGAIFTIQVPMPIFEVDEEKNQKLDPEKILERNQLPNLSPDKRILIIDDDQDICFLIGKIIESMNFTYDVAHNGRQGIQLLIKQHYDLVLMDIQMPIMGGLEAVKEIREHPKLKHHCVIALTAKAIKNQVKEIFQAGFDVYVSKPIDINKFRSIVYKQLEKSQVESSEV